MTRYSMAQTINLALDSLLSEDHRTILIGEDIGLNGGVFRVTSQLMEKYGEDRVIDSPLAENMIAGLSIGMAMQGLKPIAEFQFLGFIYPALEQIISHVSKMRYRTLSRLSCPIIFRTPYGGGLNAPEHHSESTEGLFAQIPGLRVLTPSTPAKAYSLMRAAFQSNDPVIFLEPTKLYHASKQEITTFNDNININTASIENNGQHLTLISWGPMMVESRKIVSAYREHGIHIELIDLVSLQPIDYDTIINSVLKTRRCVIVSEAANTVGVASEIAYTIQEKLFNHLIAPVKRVNADHHVIPYYKLESMYRPNINKISKVINQVLAWKN